MEKVFMIWASILGSLMVYGVLSLLIAVISGTITGFSI